MTIASGLFDTPLPATVSDDLRAAPAARAPHPRRIGSPNEYAALVRPLHREPDAQRGIHPARQRAANATRRSCRMTNDPVVLTEAAAGVLTITLNRPTTRNAVNRQLAE